MTRFVYPKVFSVHKKQINTLNGIKRVIQGTLVSILPVKGIFLRQWHVHRGPSQGPAAIKLKFSALRRSQLLSHFLQNPTPEAHLMRTLRSARHSLTCGPPANPRSHLMFPSKWRLCRSRHRNRCGKTHTHIRGTYKVGVFWDVLDAKDVNQCQQSGEKGKCSEC